MRKTLTWLLAGAALSLTAGAAAAQDAAREAEEDAAKAERRMDRLEDRRDRLRHRHRDVLVMRHHGHDRADHLRTLLQLRPNQEPALTAFLEATGDKRGPGHVHVMRFDRDDEGKTTAERLSEMEATMAEQQAAMKKRIDATRAFYAQLDEKQRKVFDTMPMLMMAGPGFGPMLLPRPMPVAHRRHFHGERFEHPLPPEPPLPPAPPRS